MFQQKYPDYEPNPDPIGLLLDVFEKSKSDSELSSYVSFFDSVVEKEKNQLVPLKDTGNFLYQKEQGLPMMNPLLEASLLERIQFDGDIPEWRNRLSLENLRPAVPIESHSQDMRVIAKQLQYASDNTKKEIEDNLRMLEEKKETGLVQLSKIEPSHYQTGQVAKFTKAPEDCDPFEEVSTKEVERVFLSQQGRKSVVYSLSQRLFEFFKQTGHKPQLRTLDRDADFSASYDFVFRGSFNPNFALLEVAFSSLSKKIKKENTLPKEITFSVQDKSDLSMRHFCFVLSVWVGKNYKKALSG